MKRIYKISKWIHKYIGLILLLFIAWMSISGILLNHPGIFRYISVSKPFIPQSYYPKNWSRSSLKGIVYDEKNKERFYVYGRQGVYLTTDNGNNFVPFMEGEYPQKAWTRRTHHIYSDTNNNIFLAGTNSGLYHFDNKCDKWRKVALPSQDEPIFKILKMEDNLLLISSSSLLVSKYNELNFTQHFPDKISPKNDRVSLVSLFLKLHDGGIFGKFGHILWDIWGLIFFFLSLSAFYIWFYPKKWKRNYKKRKQKASKKEKKQRSFYLKYHKKLGLYVAVFLLIITVTGMFLRPPFIIFLAGKSISEKYYPKAKHDNPWKDEIRNGFYDSLNKRVILETTEGLYAGNLMNKDTFKTIDLPINIFAMGTTVFQEETPGTAIIGSFGGLQRLNMANNEIENILQVEPSKNRGRPLSVLVTGYIKTPDNTEYVLGHYKGICDKKGKPVKDALKMPQIIRENSKLPFWNLMFELHNARIFKGWLGSFYILIIPLSSLMILFVLLSGVYDYFYKK